METVTIQNEEYLRLQTAYHKLVALQAAGIAEWPRYRDTMDAVDELIERYHLQS